MGTSSGLHHQTAVLSLLGSELRLNKIAAEQAADAAIAVVRGKMAK